MEVMIKLKTSVEKAVSCKINSFLFSSVRVIYVVTDLQIRPICKSVITYIPFYIMEGRNEWFFWVIINKLIVSKFSDCSNIFGQI